MNQTGVSDDSEEYFFLYGLLATTCAAFFTVIGELLIKKSFEESAVVGKCRCFGLNSTWWFGFSFIVLITTPIDMFALGVASASLVFPVGVASTVVLNQFIAPKFFFKEEKLGNLDWAATFFIITGAIVSSVFGDHASHTYTTKELLGLYYNWVFIVVIVVLSGLFLFSVIVISCLKGNKSLLLAACVYIPGYLGGLQTISFKSLAEITTNTVQGKSYDWDNSPYPYIFLTTTIVLAIGQIRSLNYGAAKFSAIIFFPAYNAVIMVCVVLLGSIFFEEFESLHPVAFPLGLFFIGGGVLTLARNKKNSVDRSEGYRPHAPSGSLQMLSTYVPGK